MTVAVFDFKKAFKEYYLPKSDPVLVRIPAMTYIMADGLGDPNNNPQFDQVIENLYGIAYVIKMSKMKGNQPEGYFEYTVPPLEGLWWVEKGVFSLTQRHNWQWTLMIRQPEFVNNIVLEWAKNEIRKKKPEKGQFEIRLETFEEGLSVHALHIGPYATEPETMKKIDFFILQNQLNDLVGKGGKHHEIYLSDPRKAKPERMKTILRHPVLQL